MPRRHFPLVCALLSLLALAVGGGSSFAQVDTLGTRGRDAADSLRAESLIEAVEPVMAVISDTLVMIDGESIRLIQSVPIGQLGHSPETATMYAAILPGLGQIYNKKYWKLPLLYGGAAALVYAIHFNNKYYKRYSNAYRDFVLQDPNNKSYMYFVERSHLTEELVQGTYKQWFTTALRNKKDYYRRYRDLSIFGIIGLYAIQIVDACVDAHFFNFDVSDDLSFRWGPELDPQTRNIGARLAFRF